MFQQKLRCFWNAKNLLDFNEEFFADNSIDLKITFKIGWCWHPLRE